MFYLLGSSNTNFDTLNWESLDKLLEDGVGIGGESVSRGHSKLLC